MIAPRRLLAALALATALLVPAAAAQAAIPGINVTALTATGDPNGGWDHVTETRAKTIRSFAAWHVLTALATVTLYLYYESEREAA